MTLAVILSAVMGFGFGPARSDAGLLDWFRPGESVAANFDRLEAGLTGLLEDLDVVMARDVVQAVQILIAYTASARTAMADVEDKAVSDLRGDRPAALEGLQKLSVELDRMLAGEAPGPEDIGALFQEVMAAAISRSGTPWIVTYGPQAFVTGRDGEFWIHVEGRRLDNRENRLRVGETLFEPIGRSADELDFAVDRAAIEALDLSGPFSVEVLVYEQGIEPPKLSIASISHWIASWLVEGAPEEWAYRLWFPRLPEPIAHFEMASVVTTEEGPDVVSTSGDVTLKGVSVTLPDAVQGFNLKLVFAGEDGAEPIARHFDGEGNHWPLVVDYDAATRVVEIHPGLAEARY